ncbi:MAG: hypothetical protein U0414_19170 [Polyangiaceae bacterium]
MKSAEEQYTDDINDRFGGYFAAWTPGAPVALGDYGFLEDNAFRRVGNLASLGIAFKRMEDPSAETIGPFKSSASTQVSFKAAGTAVPPGSVFTQAEAGLSIEFSEEHSTVFVAEDCRQPQIEDLVALEDVLRDRYDKDKWDRHWRIVATVVESSATSVLISSSSQARVDLKVDAGLGAPGLATLGNASAGLSVASSRNMELVFLAKPATPLFKLVHLRIPLIGRNHVVFGMSGGAGRDLSPADIKAQKQRLRLVEETGVRKRSSRG